MLSGKRFKLTRPAMALDSVVRQGWITIPTGAIIRVIAGPNDGEEQMIEVLWEDRMLAMYAIDVTAGCRENCIAGPWRARHRVPAFPWIRGGRDRLVVYRGVRRVPSDIACRLALRR